MLDGVVRRGLGHATQSLGEAIMWHGVILFMCISSTPDDAPEPQRLEPVGVHQLLLRRRDLVVGDASQFTFNQGTISRPLLAKTPLLG